jgi:Domain of unknown function (DUF5615)
VELFQIYIDEDAVHGGLVAALRSRDVTVTTASDAGLIAKPDGEHLAYATEHGCVLYSFNVSDFYRLHTEWVSAGREHGGMILGPQQRYSVGEQLRRFLRIRAGVSTRGMRNRVEFLGAWG